MSVVESMKDVAELVKKFNDIELNRHILNLENEVLDLSRDKRRLEEKVEELERTLRLRRELHFFEPFYWAKGDATPYCPSCWEAKTSAVHLLFGHDSTDGSSAWKCPSCKHEYWPKGHRQTLVAGASRVG